MIIDYIAKIKAHISIYATKKTSNILDGEYKSIYKGRSMDFDELREYVIGDDIKYIDWKSSARSGTTLVRRYIAEKRHNIMFVLDTGSKMLADSKDIESKKEISLMTFGTLAYLVNQHGDNFGAIYNKNNGIYVHPLKNGMQNLQKILYNYEKDIKNENNITIDDSLNYIIKYIKRKMIIIVITDIDGIEQIKDVTLKRLSTLNDIMFINISDAYITGDNGYDIDSKSYIPDIILKDSKLQQLEKELRNDLYSNCKEKLKKYKISMITINNSKEIITKIIELLERHKNASIS